MTASHLNYCDLCNDPDQCAHGKGTCLFDNIRRIYAEWDSAKTGDELIPGIITDIGNDMNGGIGVMVKEPNSTDSVLKILHGAARTRFSEGVFMYLGDVSGDKIETVKIDIPSLLNTTEVIRIANSNSIHEAFFPTPGQALVVPTHAATAANTTEITTRPGMYIPYPLIPFVIGKNLTATQSYTKLNNEISKIYGMGDVCKPLLNWLIVATTTDGSIKIRRDKAGIVPPNINEINIERKTKILYRQLPALVHPLVTVSSSKLFLGALLAYVLLGIWILTIVFIAIEMIDSECYTSAEHMNAMTECKEFEPIKTGDCVNYINNRTGLIREDCIFKTIWNTTCQEEVEEVHETNIKDCDQIFKGDAATIHNIVFGLVSAVAVQFLIDGEKDSFSLITSVYMKRLSKWHIPFFKLLLSNLPLNFVFIWVISGAFCLILTCFSKVIGEGPLYTTGQTWLGIAVPSVYKYFGTKPPTTPKEDKNIDEEREEQI